MMKAPVLGVLVLSAAFLGAACSEDGDADGGEPGMGGSGPSASDGASAANGIGGSTAGLGTGSTNALGTGGSGAPPAGGASATDGQNASGGASGPSTGGSAPSGGSLGTGGMSTTGGATTTGGASATGGAGPGSGGAGGAGTGGVVAGTGGVELASAGSPPATGGAGNGAGGADGGAGATFVINAAISSQVATVGIVEWSIDQEVTSARIEFGREQGAHEYSAPVDLAAPSHRTLLLGMKPATAYYFRVVAEGTRGTYTSDVQTIETEFLPNALPPVEVTDTDPTALFGGFTVNCTGVASGGIGQDGGNTWVFILDRDGEMVWAYDFTDTPASGCSRARMSYDGKHMWAGNFSNVSPDGALVRVTMDGLSEPQAYSFPGRHHDFAVLPNNHILFYEQQNGGGYSEDGTEGPDIIEELDPETGVATQLYHENTDFSVQISESGAHTNQIRFVPFMNAISFSLRHTSTIGVISYPEAQLITVFGGPISYYPVEWSIQHGHQVLEDTVLIFNNEGTNGGSSIIEFAYDIEAKTATKVFDYSSGNGSMAFGDVQRLSNGNTFITYSSTGVFHEVDASGALLREMYTDPVGYSEHRRTLYGPPPPFAD